MRYKNLLGITALVFLMGLARHVVAQNVTPDAVVRDLYRVHRQDVTTDKDRILNNKSRKYLDKYFDKTLADLIWKDLTMPNDYAGVIDFDPFYATQDPDIKSLSVSAPQIIGTKATVIVKFTNGHAKETVSYQLIKRNAAWKIDGIRYDHGTSLLGYFKEDKK